MKGTFTVLHDIEDMLRPQFERYNELVVDNRFRPDMHRFILPQWYVLSEYTYQLARQAAISCHIYDKNGDAVCTSSFAYFPLIHKVKLDAYSPEVKDWVEWDFDLL